MNKEILNVARGEKRADLVLKNGKIVDVFNEELYEGDLAIANGVIVGTGNYEGFKEIDLKGQILAPGFIDGHLHLESAMVSIEEFARLVIPLGTTTIFADPHEIANVAGLTGIRYVLKHGEGLPWNFNIMLPSCVPATNFETSGANLGAKELKEILGEKGIFGLGEVMDFSGVIEGEDYIWDKIKLVGEAFKDGHAPGLKGKELNSYLLAGIKADHEATTVGEALEKVKKGMYIMIREGSVTRDLENLLPAVNDKNSSSFLFATDDRHPEDLLKEGHINFLIKKAIKKGMDPLKAIKLATLNAARALGLNNIGAIAPGFKADLVVINNFNNLTIRKVFKDGQLVADEGTPLFAKVTKDDIKEDRIFKSVNISTINEKHFEIPAGNKYRVIEIIKDQVITREKIIPLKGKITEDRLVKEDLVKVAVVERHQKTGNIGLGLLKGTGLKKGAIASSIAHDSHNIIVAGINSIDMKVAVEKLAELQGGIVIVKDRKVLGSLALPIAGLMSDRSMSEVAGRLEELRKISLSLGIRITGPFMTLSFMALPVIPELKITDKGLFDVNKFKFSSLVVD